MLYEKEPCLTALLAYGSFNNGNGVHTVFRDLFGNA